MGMMTRRNVKARVAKAAPAVKKVIEKPAEKVDEDLISRDEVEKMPYFGLKALAQKHEIDVEGKKASKLKEELIDKLNL